MKEAYCFQCKKKIEVTRRRAKNYCSSACKQKAYRGRSNEEVSTSKSI